MIQQKKEFLRMLFIEHFLQLLSVHLPCLGQSTKLTWGLLESKTNTKPGQHEWSNRTSIMINLWPHVTACLCIMRMLNKRKPFFGVLPASECRHEAQPKEQSFSNRWIGNYLDNHMWSSKNCFHCDIKISFSFSSAVTCHSGCLQPRQHERHQPSFIMRRETWRAIRVMQSPRNRFFPPTRLPMMKNSSTFVKEKVCAEWKKLP